MYLSKNPSIYEKTLGLVTWSIVLPLEKLHQYSKFYAHVQIHQSLQS